jgi:HK97 family phage portal protein
MFTVRHPRHWFRPEERAIDKMDLWGKGLPWDLDDDTGLPFSRDRAARVVAVYACVSLRANTIAQLPADVFRKQRGGERVEVEPEPLWLRSPNPETNWFEFVERINTSLDFDGNAFVVITARDRLGFPAELWTLNPDQVEVRREGGELLFYWTGATPAVTFDRFGPLNPFGAVLHIKNTSWGQDRAPSPIAVARQALSLSSAAEKFGARFFGRGQQLSGVIELPPQEGGKTDEVIRRIRENWEQVYGGIERSHRTGVLSGGAKWVPISIKPEEAQFLETRKFQVTEIARLFQIPPHMIADVEKSTSWGTGIEQQQIGFVQYSIAPRLARLEHAFNQLLPRGQFIKWNVTGLLRGDAASRAEFYQSGILNGWMLRSEARSLEDLPRIPELDKPTMPTNVTILGEEPESVPATNGAGDPENVLVPQ